MEEAERELNGALQAAAARTAALRAEWDAVRAPLEARLAAAAAAGQTTKAQAEAALADMQRLRAETRALATAAKAREEAQRALVAEYEAAPKRVNRGAFVRRILEIVKSVRKQDGELARVSSDTRALLRDVNGAREALARAHALVDEVVFRDARRDEAAREAYRLLSAIHSGFADLGARVEEAAKCARSARELERELEAGARAPLDAQRAEQDADAAAAENDAAEARLRALQGAAG